MCSRCSSGPTSAIPALPVRDLAAQSRAADHDPELRRSVPRLAARGITSGDRLTRKATSTIGGPEKPHAAIEGWRAEFFIPYTLLKPLQNVPPEPGTRWRANFYRIDHDEGKLTQVGLVARWGDLS